MSRRAGDLVFVGDVHLEHDDPALPDFLGFLERLPATTSRLVLMGDLFQLWLGARHTEQAHHRAVLERLRALRAAGVHVAYLEGNRDFHLARHEGDALDRATDAGVVLQGGGRSIFAIHGDLANPEDRQYRTWRRIARSRAAWSIFLALPGRSRMRAALGLERRMRGSNTAFKDAFPEAAVRAYAAQFLSRGHEVVVLGHFHVERDLQALPPSPRGRILVLPEWKGSRRHLVVRGEGPIGFVDSASG